MKITKKDLSFLSDPIAIVLFSVFFGFFVLLLSYDRIQKHFKAPTKQEIKELDDLAAKARSLSSINPDSSLMLTLEVLDKSQKVNYQKGLADSYRLLSIASLQARNFVLTKEFIEKARGIYEDLGDEAGLADIENSVGRLFIYLGDTASAIAPYRRSLELHSRLDNTDRIRVAAFNLAFSYSALSRLDSIKYFLKVCEDLKADKDDVPGFAIIEGLKGKIDFLEGSFEKAEEHFRASLDYYNEKPAQQSFVAFFESTLYLASIFESRGDIYGSINLLARSLSSESIYLSESLARKVFVKLINLYEDQGDLENANKVFWAKERFEAELERRKVQQAKNFSAELILYRGFEIENEALSSRLSTVTVFSLLGGVFTFFILILFLRVIFLNRKNKELKTLLDKSFQIAQIGTFEVWIDLEEKIQLVDVSDIIANILAIKDPEVTEHKIDLNALIDSDQKELLQSILAHYKDSSRFFIEEFHLTNFDNELRIVRVIAKVNTVSKGVVALNGILLDITQEYQMLEQTQQNLEKEKRLKELREQLMHMTSHEFRSPLANISSAIDLIGLLNQRITQEDLQFRFKNITQTARGNIGRLVGMLDDLLLYERVQSNEFDVKPERFDLKPYLETLVEEVRSASGTDPNILLMISEGGLFINSDKELLHHIFTNLLSNAVKYLDKKLPIEFEVLPKEEKVVFRIKDYGIGIPQKDMEKLFTPFKRASNVSGRPGTGLGLSIVLRMVTKLGGTLEVSSEEGKFTEFVLTLPQNNDRNLTE